VQRIRHDSAGLRGLFMAHKGRQVLLSFLIALRAGAVGAKVPAVKLSVSAINYAYCLQISKQKHGDLMDRAEKK
jgi:hypothetical protein